MAHRLKMKKFGHKRFYPRPRTPEQWNSLYNAHKQLIPNVEKITLQWSSRGAEQTGVRYFKYYNVQPLKHWNPQLEVELLKLREEDTTPKVLVQFKDGEQKEIDPKGLKNKDILKAIVALDTEGQIITLGPGFLGPAYHE